MKNNEIKKQIISYLGITKLSVKKAEKVMLTLDKNIQREIILSFLGLLKPEAKEELALIIKFGNKKDISLFLKSKISNFDNLLQSIPRSFVLDLKKTLR